MLGRRGVYRVGGLQREESCTKAQVDPVWGLQQRGQEEGGADTASHTGWF